MGFAMTIRFSQDYLCTAIYIHRRIFNSIIFSSILLYYLFPPLPIWYGDGKVKYRYKFTENGPLYSYTSIIAIENGIDI